MAYDYSDPNKALAEAERRVAKCKGAGTKSLDLSGLGLTSLPAALDEIRQLQWLDLSVNQLCELPAGLCELKELRELMLGSNQLRELPASFGELRELSKLSLHSNRLRELPASFGELKQLRSLYLEHNQLHELPTSFGEIKQLTILFLFGNPGLGLPRAVVNEWDSPATILDYYFLHHPLNQSARPVSNSPENVPKLEVFLCHASADKQRVREIYGWLKENGFEPWLDAENLDPGDDWLAEITKAVKRSHVVLVCLSQHSMNKEGFVQREIRMALNVADEKPDGTIYIIPVRLEECAVPDRLNNWHWLSLFEEGGYDRLAKSLRKRLSQVTDRG